MPEHRHVRTVRLTAPVWALLLAGALAACGGADNGPRTGSDPGPAADTAPSASDVDGQSFRASEVSGRDLVADTTLRIDFAEGTMSVHGGCNTMTGPFEINDGLLAWSAEPASTMMGCSEELVTQDAWLAELFQNGVNGTLTGEGLVLSDDIVSIRLTSSAAATLDDVLGRTWTLDGVIDRDSVSSVPRTVERVPSLTVEPDGTAALDTGCNTGRTDVALGTGTLTFSAPALTRMACPADAGDLEQTIVKVLDGTAEATWDGVTLQLRKGKVGLIFTLA